MKEIFRCSLQILHLRFFQATVAFKIEALLDMSLFVLTKIEVFPYRSFLYFSMVACLETT